MLNIFRTLSPSVSMALTVFCLYGFIVNVFVMVVIVFKRIMHSVHYFLLSALALTDALKMGLSLPFYIYINFSNNNFLCNVAVIVDMSLAGITNYLVMFIVLSHYFQLVSKNYRHSSLLFSCFCVISVTITVSLSFNCFMPIFMYVNVFDPVANCYPHSDTLFIYLSGFINFFIPIFIIGAVFYVENSTKYSSNYPLTIGLLKFSVASSMQSTQEENSRQINARFSSMQQELPRSYIFTIEESSEPFPHLKSVDSSASSAKTKSYSVTAQMPRFDVSRIFRKESNYSNNVLTSQAFRNISALTTNWHRKLTIAVVFYLVLISPYHLIYFVGYSTDVNSKSVIYVWLKILTFMTAGINPFLFSMINFPFDASMRPTCIRSNNTELTNTTNRTTVGLGV